MDEATKASIVEEQASGKSPCAPSSEDGAPIPPEREKNIRDRKKGYEYILVTIQFKTGMKFGLGIKNVYKNIFVLKIEENSIVSGLFKEADRLIDVDGEVVSDNTKCKQLLIKGLKNNKKASVLVERGVTDQAIKEATDEMNEEHNQSVLAPPDVRSIMRRMEERMSKGTTTGTSALSKNKGSAERKACVLEDGHKSVMINMDNAENKEKLIKVAKGTKKDV